MGDDNVIGRPKVEIRAGKDVLRADLDAAAAIAKGGAEKIGQAFTAGVATKVTASEKAFDKFQKRIQSLQQDLSGSVATARANELAIALERIGGTAKLSEANVTRLQNRIRSLQERGAQLPTSLQGLLPQAPATAPEGKTVSAATLAELQRAAEGAAGGLGRTGSALAALGSVGLPVAAALAAVVAMLAKFSSSTLAAAKHAEELKNQAQSLELSTSKLQTLRETAASGDLPFEKMEASVEALNDKLIRSPELFARVGLSAKQLKAESPADALLDVVRTAQNLSSGQTAFLKDVFGKVGPQLAKLDTDAREAAEGLGLVWSDEQISQSARLSDEAGKLGRVWDGLWLNIGLSAARSPDVVESLKSITTALGGISKWVLDHGSRVTGFFHDLLVRAANFNIDPMKWAANIRAWEQEERDRQKSEENRRKEKPTGPAYHPANTQAEALAKQLAQIARDEAKAQRNVSDELLAQAGIRRIAVSEAEKGLTATEKTVQRAKDLAQMHAEVVKRLQEEAAAAGALSEETAEAVRKGREKYLLDRALPASLVRTGQYGEILDYGPQAPTDLGPSQEQIKKNFDDITAAAKASGKSTAEWEQKHIKAVSSIGPGFVRTTALAQIARGEIDRGTASVSNLSFKIQDLSAAIQILPGIAGTAFASMLGSMGAAADAGRKLKASLDPGLDKDGKPIKKDYAAAAIAGAQGIGALANAYGAKTQGQRAVGGALAGAQAGAAFGPWGAAIGGAIGGLGGLIVGDPGWAKAGKDVGRIIGISISDEEAKTLEDEAKRLGIGRTEAVELNLVKFAEEAGRPLTDFKDKTIDLFNALGNGAVPAREGIAALKEQWQEFAAEGAFLESPELVDRLFQGIRDGSMNATSGTQMLSEAFESMASAAQSGVEGADAAMLKFIRDAKAGGQELNSIKKWTAEQFGTAGADLSALYGGTRAATAEELAAGSAQQIALGGGLISGPARQADLLNANLQAISQSSDLAAAIKELSPAFAAMSDEARAAAGPLAQLMSEAAAPIVEQGSALQRQTRALAGTDTLTAGAFAALAQGVLTERQQLEAAGVSQEATFQAIADQTANLMQASKDYGFALPKELEATVQSMREAGVGFKADATQNLADITQNQQIPALTDNTTALRELASAMGSGSAGLSRLSLPSYQVPTIPESGGFMGGPGSLDFSPILQKLDVLAGAIASQPMDVTVPSINMDGEKIADGTTTRISRSGAMMGRLEAARASRGYGG